MLLLLFFDNFVFYRYDKILSYDIVRFIMISFYYQTRQQLIFNVNGFR